MMIVVMSKEQKPLQSDHLSKNRVVTCSFLKCRSIGCAGFFYHFGEVANEKKINKKS